MLLCSLFGRRGLRKMPPRDCSSCAGGIATAAIAVRAAVLTLSVLMVFLSLVQMDLRFGGTSFSGANRRFVEPLRLVNSYGLFAVMTTQRDEIIEGSYDGADRECEFGTSLATLRRPSECPHQPRLDYRCGLRRWMIHVE